jgi:hypothetical protein
MMPERLVADTLALSGAAMVMGTLYFIRSSGFHLSASELVPQENKVRVRNRKQSVRMEYNLFAPQNYDASRH